ncbi:MAG: hypothetical protein Q7T07_16375 [Burkholderiaceae bacterium]|nr:hypothetical protein [Burkholderiaceae bacterium]
MSRLKGWGLLLGICIPLLFYFSWSRLQTEKARINIERYEAWAGDGAGLGRLLGLELVPYFLKNKTLAVAGDVALPAIPPKSGIKAWVLQPDAVLLVELDAKVDGQPVRLKYVPVVRHANAVFYDCVSTMATASAVVGRFCYGDVVKSDAGIAAQLATNKQVMDDAPAVVSTSGVVLPAGGDAGSVVAVPANVGDLEHCGFQCVKPQSCITPRPLACSKLVTEGNSGYLAIAPTHIDYRGSDFASRSAADKACEQSVGEGYKVLIASSISGKFKLVGGNEYWVHNEVQAEKNCWKTDSQ